MSFRKGMYTGDSALALLRSAGNPQGFNPQVWLYKGKRTTHYSGRLTYYFDEGEGAPEMFSIGEPDNPGVDFQCFLPEDVQYVEVSMATHFKVRVRKLMW